MNIQDFSKRITPLPWFRGTVCTDHNQAKLNRTYADHCANNMPALVSSVKELLTNNGGPLDAAKAVDGKEYVMVLRSDFEKVEAEFKKAEEIAEA